MDLSSLGSTLPPGLADAERDMGEKFRAAALNITNLYKSSLNYTKQAYHAGYAACLADVLSTVQSSIAGSQDASQTLSRLMDWAEARETAMAAFAAEDGDEPSSASPATNPTALKQRANMARQTQQALQHLAQPVRPSSAPIPEHMRADAHGGTTGGHVKAGTDTPTPGSGPNLSNLSYQPTPRLRSSSPSMPSSSSVPRPFVSMPQHKRRPQSPIRSLHRSDTSGSNSSLPTVTMFNPNIPNLPTHQLATPSPASVIPTGSKRPLQQLDYEMGEGDAAAPTGATVVAPHTPSARSHRAIKRRAGNHRPGSDDGGDEKEKGKDRERDRDRDGKRKGGRRGHGAAGGQGVF